MIGGSCLLISSGCTISRYGSSTGEAIDVNTFELALLDSSEIDGTTNVGAIKHEELSTMETESLES